MEKAQSIIKVGDHFNLKRKGDADCRDWVFLGYTKNGFLRAWDRTLGITEFTLADTLYFEETYFAFSN
jgi:hypothetical protein